MTVGLPEADRLAETLRILGHPLRLAILRVVAEGERAVSDIATMTGIAMSTLSQQLAILRKADLVRTRRDARQVFYSLDPEALHGVVADLAAIERPTGATGLAHASMVTAQTGAAVFARVKPRGDDMVLPSKGSASGPRL